MILSPSRIRLGFLSVVALGLFSGCKKKEDEESTTKATESEVKFIPNLLRLDVSNATDVFMRQLAQTAHLDTTQTLSMDVKVLSLKYPIASVGLNNADPEGGTTASGNLSIGVYTCPESTVEGCLVELTGDALTNLLTNAQGATANVGTYTAISISMCPEGVAAGDAYFKLTAEATISGVKYYSNKDLGLSTTGPAEEISLPNGGGCGSNNFLAEPLVVTSEGLEVPEDSEVVAQDDAGAELEPVTSGTIKGNIPIRLYFDLANAAYASSGSTNPGDGKPSNNCYGSSGQTPYICLNFPQVVGTVDSKDPTVTRMLLNDHTIWGFYQGAGETPFGIYQRVYYTGNVYTGALPTNFIGPGFKKPIKVGDTLSFDSYNDGRYFKVTDFKLVDHAGSFDWTGVTTNYTAVKIP